MLKRQKKGNPGASHYDEMQIDPLEVMGATFDLTWELKFQARFPGVSVALVAWSLCNVLKYTMRFVYKNGIEDLRKAQFYLGDAIRRMEESPVISPPHPQEYEELDFQNELSYEAASRDAEEYQEHSDQQEHEDFAHDGYFDNQEGDYL